MRDHFGQIHIVSYHACFAAVIEDALQEASLRVSEQSPLRIISLPHLVVLKLYSGGLKSMTDIGEVLSVNEDADLDAIDSLCRKYRIRGFSIIRKELENK